MIRVIKKRDEDFESLFRRFKSACNREGILEEYQKRSYYRKRGVRIREKHQRALYLKNSKEHTNRK